MKKKKMIQVSHKKPQLLEKLSKVVFTRVTPTMKSDLVFLAGEIKEAEYVREVLRRHIKKQTNN